MVLGPLRVHGLVHCTVELGRANAAPAAQKS